MDLEYSCAYLCMYLFLCMYPFFHAYEPEWCFLLDYKGLVFTQFIISLGTSVIKQELTTTVSSVIDCIH